MIKTLLRGILSIGILLPLVAAPGDAWARDYFIDRSRAPGGDGLTPATAWASFAETKYAMLAAGDRVLVSPGVYQEQPSITSKGAAGSPITFKADGAVRITRGLRLESTAQYVRIEGFEITNDQRSNPWGWGIYVGGSYCEVINNYVHHTGYLCGIGIDGSENLIQGNTIAYAEGIGLYIDGRRNTILNNEVSHSTCFFTGDADASRFFGEGHVIRGNYFHDVTPDDTPGKQPHCDCFQTYAVNNQSARNITIENNICRNIGGQMLMIEGDLSRSSHDNITFRNNIFDGVGGWAFNGGGIKNFTLERNTIANSGIGAIVLNGENISVRNNIFYNNPTTYNAVAVAADFNLTYPSDCQQAAPEPHGLSGINPEFLDEKNGKFVPSTGSPVCNSASDGAHLGAVPCDNRVLCNDADGDGYGKPARSACPSAGLDCDNLNKAINPGAAELCDGIDNDCDRFIDEGCSQTAPILHLSFERNIDDSTHNFSPRWINGPGAYSAGTIGESFALNGGSATPYILIENDRRLGGMGLFGISLWARKSDASRGGVLLNRHVFYNLELGAAGVSAYLVTSTGMVNLEAARLTTIQNTAWHLYQLSYDAASGKAVLYVDGVSVAEGHSSGFIKDAPCDNRDLLIGRSPWSEAFYGEIDEFRVYQSPMPIGDTITAPPRGPQSLRISQ